MGERRIDPPPDNDVKAPQGDVAAALRALADAILESNRETRSSVDRLEKSVNRFCVVAERILSSNEQAQERARNALSAMHPNMDKIMQDVANKTRGVKR
jgi:phosphate uptake regulator